MLKTKGLGSGYVNYINLEKLCREVVTANSIDAEIEKITDFNEIMNYGIMMMPGLIVSEKVKAPV